MTQDSCQCETQSNLPNFDTHKQMSDLLNAVNGFTRSMKPIQMASFYGSDETHPSYGNKYFNTQTD